MELTRVGLDHIFPAWFMAVHSECCRNVLYRQINPNMRKRAMMLFDKDNSKTVTFEEFVETIDRLRVITRCIIVLINYSVSARARTS